MDSAPNRFHSWFGVPLSKNKRKGQGVAAIIISVVGTIIAVIVLLVVLADAVDDALSGGDVTVTEPSDNPESSGSAEEADRSQDDGDKQETAKADANSRSNPFAIGTTVAEDDWDFTLNSVNLDATQAVLDENPFNDSPAKGNSNILANVSLKYLGNDDEGSTPWATVKYVTVDGNSIADYVSFAVVPNALDSLQTMYEGASVTGTMLSI